MNDLPHRKPPRVNNKHYPTSDPRSLFLLQLLLFAVRSSVSSLSPPLRRGPYYMFWSGTIRAVAPYSFFFFFFLTLYTFQLPDKPWSQVSSLLPPGPCLQFLSRIVFSNPTARRFFIECCYLTLSRIPQVNLCKRQSPNECLRVCTRRGSNSRN